MQDQTVIRVLAQAGYYRSSVRSRVTENIRDKRVLSLLARLHISSYSSTRSRFAEQIRNGVVLVDEDAHLVLELIHP